MLNEETKKNLLAMRLPEMASAWDRQQQDPACAGLSFDERLGLLVEAEYMARENRRLARRMKSAQLRVSGACVEDVASSSERGLERSEVAQLTSGRWLSAKQNVLISGPAGVGKSYVACALGQLACRRGFTALYRRVPRLFEELALARADGTYAKRLTQIARVDVLILDDFGLGKTSETQRHDLLEVLEDRSGLRSVVITSQLPVSKWHDWIGDPTLADAIMDRLVHDAYKLTLKGPPRRKEKIEKQEP
ncbi:MAG: IS21-like element helper ATPase IstB [Kofleriaceae bacterium]|nr:IS21-like element helper ATPase IstB [Kofleriaceae bacterium]